ncbi:MAG: HGGxSTG domain-containing protein [Agrobacterium cavarae]
MQAARKQVRCGAKTRKGTACRHLSEPGKARCKFHGGKSTGPKTEEGIARIAEAQRRRWDTFRYRKRIEEYSAPPEQPSLDHLR